MSVPASKVAPWEDFVLRLIAIYKLLHGAFFTLVGVGLLKLRHHDVVDFLNVHLIIPYHLNPEGHLVDWLLDTAAKVNPHMLVLLGWGSFFYAALFFAEGVGLYLRKHWAEYLVVAVTGSLLPVEVWTLIHHPVLWKFVAVAGNLAIVSYLIHRLVLDARNRRSIEREKKIAERTSPPLRPPQPTRSPRKYPSPSSVGLSRPRIP